MHRADGLARLFATNALVSASRARRSHSRGSTRTTPSAGTEVAATGRTIPRARALRRKAGVRISAAPSSSSLALSPSSERRYAPPRTTLLWPRGEARHRTDCKGERSSHARSPTSRDSNGPEGVVSRAARWWLLSWPSRRAPTTAASFCDSSISKPRSTWSGLLLFDSDAEAPPTALLLEHCLRDDPAAANRRSCSLLLAAQSERVDARAERSGAAQKQAPGRRARGLPLSRRKAVAT